MKSLKYYEFLYKENIGGFANPTIVIQYLKSIFGKDFGDKILESINSEEQQFINKIIEKIQPLNNSKFFKLTELTLKQIKFHLFFEFLFEEDFKKQNKDISKYFSLNNEYKNHNNKLLNSDSELVYEEIEKCWKHNNHPITIALFFNDSVPCISNLKKFQDDINNTTLNLKISKKIIPFEEYELEQLNNLYEIIIENDFIYFKNLKLYFFKMKEGKSYVYYKINKNNNVPIKELLYSAKPFIKGNFEKFLNELKVYAKFKYGY